MERVILLNESFYFNIANANLITSDMKYDIFCNKR